MSDLVERLTYKADMWKSVFQNRPSYRDPELITTLREAADEIASLRKANALLLNTITKQDAEIARLREALRLALVFMNTLHLLPVTTSEAQKITLAEVSARAREALGE